MAIEWTPELSVGVEHIDDQHKEWFKKANDLFEAGKNGKSKEYVGEMLKFLDEYTKKHFKDEEAYIEEIKYPEIEQQRIAHRNFAEKLAKLKKDFEESGGNITVVVNANRMVVEWLTGHISNMDKKIGVYVKSL